jgi:ABC-type transport system substrate-binding protein
VIFVPAATTPTEREDSTMAPSEEELIAIRLSRRRFLAGVGMAGVAAALAACGSTSSTSSSATTAPSAGGASSNPTTAPASAAASAAASSSAGASGAAGGAGTTNLGVALPADAASYDQQIYRAMITSEPKFMERAAGVSGSGSYFPYYFTEPLVRINEDFDLVGAVAESWDVSQDGLTWTFKIRNGLQWSDGQPLDANDVVFTYQRIADPTIAFDWSWFFTDIAGLSDISTGKAPMSTLGVKLVDDHTVAFTMVKPAPYFPDKTLMVTISPQHVIKTTDGPVTWSTDPSTAVASGPFKLQSWDKGKQIVYVANDKYTGNFKPFLKEIRLLVGTPDAVMPAYQAGDIDSDAYEGINVTPGDIAAAKADPTTAGLHFYDDYGCYMLVFNNSMKPFDNPKVRQAIARAIDKNALAQSVGRDLSTPASSLLGPGFPAFNPDLKNVNSYDVAAAKQLLSDAGYPNGQGLSGLQIFTWGPLDAVRGGWIQGVLNQLKTNLGLDIALQVVEVNAFYTQKAKHVYPFTFQQYQYDYVDPSNLLDLFVTGKYDYSNPAYDALINQADHFVGSDADRIKLYQQAEQLLVSDAGGVFLYWPRVGQFWRPYLVGKSLSPNKAGITAFRGNKLGLSHMTMYITKDRPTIS